MTAPTIDYIEVRDTSRVAEFRDDYSTRIEMGFGGHAGQDGADGVDGVDGADGVTDHGLLTGLTDDDHPQYVLAAGDTMSGELIIERLTEHLATLTSRIAGDVGYRIKIESGGDIHFSDGTGLNDGAVIQFTSNDPIEGGPSISFAYDDGTPNPPADMIFNMNSGVLYSTTIGFRVGSTSYPAASMNTATIDSAEYKRNNVNLDLIYDPYGDAVAMAIALG